jgi:predicted glycoside hydrolase/deacetylase ChbG (UPF0249 family)
MATKKLLIIADDYGAHNIIDNGIHQCIKNGVIDGTDVFVTHESSEERLKFLIDAYKDKIASGEFIVGLHLNLNVGGPIIAQNPYNQSTEKEKHKQFKKYLRLITKDNPTNPHAPLFKFSRAIGLVNNLRKLETDYLEFIEAEMIAQFNEFKRIVGRYPGHVSSHNGIFQATEKIYRFMSKFCKENQIRMRCPTLMIFEKDFGDTWKDNPVQDLYPKWLISGLATVPIEIGALNGAEISHIWTKFQLKEVFVQDVNEGLTSTNYCVEHFFRNGAAPHPENIIKKISLDPFDKTYELIVHPVKYYSLNERNTLPAGIENSAAKIKDRDVERDTLVSGMVKEFMDKYTIERLVMPPID